MLGWMGLGGSNKGSDLGSPSKKDKEVLPEQHGPPSSQMALEHSSPLVSQQQQIQNGTNLAPHPSHPPQQRPDPPATSPIASDARQVIDTLRRDLGSQRKMLENFYEKVEPMILQLRTVTENLDALKSEASLAQLKNHFVSSTRFAEAIADVKLELNACKVAVSTTNVSKSAMSPEIVEQSVAQAVAASMQSALQKANIGGGNQWRDEFNERMIELRQELVRNYVRRDEFTTALNQVKEQSLRDVSSLQDALEASARKIGGLRRTELPAVEPPKPNLSNQMQAVERNQVSASRAPNMQNSRGSSQEDMVLITLHRHQGSKLGLSLDGSDGKTLLIESIAKDGDIPAWNAENPSLAVKPRDRIVSINDISGDSGMLIDEMSLSSASKTILQVMRAPGNRNVVQLDDVEPYAKKQLFVRFPADRGGNLGMSLKCDENDVLKIAKIAVGCVQRWNENNPSMAVRLGDQLVAVNGKSGSPSVMLEELKEGGEINLVFVRNE